MEPGKSRLIITTHPTEGTRRGELELCLAVNEASFDEVRVIAQKVRQPEWSQAIWSPREDRPRFGDLLAIIASVSSPHDLNMIANSDIIIPKKSVETVAANLERGEAYCLAKWDATPKGILKWMSGWSQDVWCFRGVPELPAGIGDYFLGVPGCDNRFARELYDAGLKVSNPMLSIPTFHSHLSDSRTSTNTEPFRVPAPYALVRSHRLGEKPNIELLDTFTPRAIHHGSNALWRRARRERKGLL